MPFTADQFFQVFERYNEAIWPAQILAYLLGLLALAAALRPSRRSGRVVAAVLALFWIWMGAAYHLWQFARINPAAYAFGLLFIAQGVAFFWIGVVRDRLRFRFRDRLMPALGLAFVAYAVILCSALGYLSGHADRPVPLSLLVVPVGWSFIGGSAAILLAVPEDIGLLVAGLVCGTLLVWRHRRRGGELAG